MRSHVLHWLESFLRADVAEAVAPGWFACVGFAGLLSLVLMLVLGKRRGIEPSTTSSAVLWCYVAAVTAGIVMPMLINAVDHLVSTGHLQLRWSGMTSFWGYLAGAAAVVYVCRRDGVSLARFADVAVIPLGFALAFARIGCFMAGCDYGKVTSLPWAVRFPSGSPAWRDHVHAGLISGTRPESLPVHPTQLYEAVLGLAIVALALFADRRKKDGQLFMLAAATYAVGRIFIETLRGDAGRGIYLGLSSGQIFSLLVLLAIGARFLFARRRMFAAMAAAALVLCVANVGEADAEPADPHGPVIIGPQPRPLDTPTDEATPTEPTPPPFDSAPVVAPGTQEPPKPGQFDPPPLAPEELPQPGPRLLRRPPFSIGLLFGAASPMGHTSEQVPTLAGTSLSFGYIPGRFGVWFDLDSFANNEASHTSFLSSVSFAPRVSKRWSIGGRAGVGLTHINFKDPVFADIAGKTVRLEAVAEFVMARHWAMWVRPITIDVVSAKELGNSLTTYQFRFGVTYRFGRSTLAPPAPVQAPDPVLPPPEPPTLPPIAEAP